MSPSDGKIRRVLVADDVNVLSELIATVLKDAGFITEVANDGEEALRKVASFRPDLMILDLMMPKMHGLDTLKNIKKDPATSHIGVNI